MHDTHLYEQILGLKAPWFVERVELNVAGQEVSVWVNHRPQAAFVCPTCGKPAALYDHAAERQWRHLDTCQFKTYLHARTPRVNCPEHGVVNVEVPWGKKNSRFTLMMERLIIDLLKVCQNIQSVGELLGIGWEAISRVMRQAVQRGLARKKPSKVRYLGIDEKAYLRGHRYITVVSDLENSSVEYVAEERTIESLAGYYRQCTPEQLSGIEAVAMDMHTGYVHATLEHVPEASGKIVFDRFHIMQKINEALDRIRKDEHFALSRKHDDVLTGTRQLWLWSQENLPEKYQERFEFLRQQDLKTARAWAIKEHLRRLWEQPGMEEARAFFAHWHDWVKRSKLPPLIRVAKSLARKLQQIVNYCRHPITSAGCEGLNSKITTVQIRAAGYRNLERFKTAILFYCGKLELYP